MAKNSRAKGARGELEWAHFLGDLGLEARRGAQYAGNTDAPDVICPFLDACGVHVEVKRGETVSLYKALEQAATDAPSRIPVVAHRKNRRPWVVSMPAEAFIRLLREHQAGRITVPVAGSRHTLGG